MGDLLGDVDRHVGLQAAGVAHRVQQVAGLGRRAGAELDQGAGLSGRGEDLGRALAEDLPLGPGRVVLRQLGDLLEQLRAALVVEVFRRQLLRVGAEAGADVARHRRRRVGVEVDVDRDHASLAQRRPEKIWRRCGRSQLRKLGPGDVGVGRPGAAAQHLVLVAEEGLGVLRVGESLEARVGAEVGGGPLPGVADRLQPRPGRLPLELGRQPLAGPAGDRRRPGPRRRGRRAARGRAAPRRPRRSAHPAAPVALPVQRRLGAGLLHELGIGAVGDRGSIDLEGGELDAVAAALVVVGEAARRGADLVLAGRDGDRLRALPGRVDGEQGRDQLRARSPRPSAAAAASSRCAGARARAAARRRSLRAAAGPRRRARGRRPPAPRACAHARRPCRRAARRRAGSAARHGSCAGSRSRRRSGRARRCSGSRPPIVCTSQSSSKLAMWPRSQASGLSIGE